MKKIAIGIIIGALLATALPAAAETVYQKVTAVVRADYKVTVDDHTAKLVNSPVIIDGSAYLPVKEVATLVGKDVDFKGGTIMITTPIETEIVIPGAAELAKKSYSSLKQRLEMYQNIIKDDQQIIEDINNGKRPESDRAAYEKDLQGALESLDEAKKELADLIAKYPELEESAK